MAGVERSEADALPSHLSANGSGPGAHLADGEATQEDAFGRVTVGPAVPQGRNRQGRWGRVTPKS